MAPKRRRARLLIGALAGGLLLLLGLLLARFGPQLLVDREAPQAADAIVVLAGDHTGGRVDKALELYRARLLAKGPFVLSGGPIYGKRTWAAAMAERAAAGGVPRERLRLQETSTTTVEDAQHTFALLGDPAPGERPVILLVTSAWHSARAARHFRAVAGERFLILSVPSADPDPAWWNDAVATRALATEVLKLVWPGPGG